MKKIKINYGIKPSYNFYVKLYNRLAFYLFCRIDTILFFKYYNWNISNIELLELQNPEDLYIIKKIYEYDFFVFKTLLYLYWDLEYYLEGKDYVKNSLIVDVDDFGLVNIKLKNERKSPDYYYNMLKWKIPLKLWTFLEMHENLDLIFKYDIYTKADFLDKYYKNEPFIEKYKLYAKYNNLINSDIEVAFRQMQADVIGPIKKLYYQEYIDLWYNEWESELNKDDITKYKNKIKNLKLEFKHLLKELKLFDNKI